MTFFALLLAMNSILFYISLNLHFPNKIVSIHLQFMCGCVGVTLGHRFYLSVELYLVNFNSFDSDFLLKRSHAHAEFFKINLILVYWLGLPTTL